MKNNTIKQIRIVDLRNNNVVEVSEAAAKLMCQTARFEYPENIHFTVEATNRQQAELKLAIDFNKGIVVAPEIKEPIVVEFVKEQFVKEPVKKANIVPDFSEWKISELRAYALEKNIDLLGSKSKKDIINIITQ